MAKDRHGHNKETKKQTSWNVKESKLITSPDATNRVDLDASAFEQLIKQKGSRVKVYRSSYCPNVKSVDGAEHQIDCQLCNGSGMVDTDCIETMAFIQSQRLDKLPQVEGMWDGNTVTMTFPIGIELQYFTLVELMDFTDIVIQRVLRKEGADIDILKYRCCRVNFIMDSNGDQYYQDQDFKISSTGDIDWTGSARKPSDNQVYTIHYEAHVQFRAKAANHVNRFTQIDLGEQSEHIKMQESWFMAKEFLVRRKDNDGNDLEQGPYDNHSIVPEN